MSNSREGSHTHAKTTARTHNSVNNYNNSKLTASNMDRSLMEQSLLERINIDKSQFG